MRFIVTSLVCLLVMWLTFSPSVLAGENDRELNEGLLIVVMDPLSDKLACDCVEGYAQRKYEKLGEYLQERIDRKITVLWGESMEASLEEHQGRKADIVIGKHSVVLSEAKDEKLHLRPFAALTGKQGNTTQTGLVVVRSQDPAQSLSDLKDYRVFYGPADCDEKFAAPQALLRQAGLEIHKEPEICGACSQAATKLIELDQDEQAAAIVSSYAAPLLEGCGAVEKGELRVLAESAPVPFITAFANTKTLNAKQVARLTKMFLKTSDHPNLLKALESKSGFVAIQQRDKPAVKDSTRSTTQSESSRSSIATKKK